MTDSKTISVPFVDLLSQHQPLEDELMIAIQAVIHKGDYILGQALADFEAAFSAACKVRYGIGVASGTDAIALGLQACGVGEGDEVILPANTFIATLIGVLKAGASPVFVDCDPRTALIDLAAAARAITAKTRAILPVHLYGQMVSPSALLDLARNHNLLIFEDAAQAHLAEREGYLAGSIGAASSFSFYPSKNLGALGDGGMILTQTELIAQTARSLRSYGATRKYYHTDPGGVNSRLDTLQAAALSVKLPHLSTWNQQRRLIAQHYDDRLHRLKSYGVSPIENQSQNGHVYHLYVIRLTPSCPINRTTLQKALNAQGVQTGIHYPIPCHLQPAFQSLGHQPGDFPHSETLSQEILSLPIYPNMTHTQIDRVIDLIENQVMEAGSAQFQPIDSVA
ncbi:MAG: DegT/DnrJ/EryC1/StrS family aminotransferase [Leptolyngbyaceae cyanobacterium MO_188.B28]|nr:DegT/DnrJ/EryC1/StrS family aminotransferase [Leptolyngbyaceae cyanobacterium MO_188.B28]